ncbi:MAG TPA: ABC transporter substrate-binding protein [Gemmatimonadaceae bacterium]|nr:ABC transporter substrate-binding protein [Gemmatimonadaceae bacterium]
MKALRLIVAAGVLVGCSAPSEDIRIGAAGPWTTGYGSMNQMGIQLAEAEINAAGGVRGQTLTVVYVDDEGDGAKAATIARQFVDTPEIVAVVGHVNSGAMVAAARVYDGALPAVATTATSPDLTGISPWVFRVISSDSVNGVDLARFANQLGHRRAAILYENNSYGRGLADAFRRNFTGEIVGIDPIADDVTNVEPYISWFRLRGPDVVFVAGTEASGMAILREARRQRLAADFLGGDGWTGVVGEPAAAEGAFVGAPFSAQDPRPEVREFVTRFRSRYGREPDGNAALAYDATMLVAQAIERGRTRAGVRDVLAAGSIDFAGVTGPIRFRPDGDPIGKSFVMTRVRNGALVVHDAPPLVESTPVRAAGGGQ